MDYSTLLGVSLAATTATTAYYFYTQRKEKKAKNRAILEREFFKEIADVTAQEWARDNKIQNLEILRLTEEHTGLIEEATKLERQKKQNLRNANIAKKILKAVVKKGETELQITSDQLAQLREEAAQADGEHLKALEAAFMESRKNPDVDFATWAGTLKFW